MGCASAAPDWVEYLGCQSTEHAGAWEQLGSVQIMHTIIDLGMFGLGSGIFHPND